MIHNNIIQERAGGQLGMFLLLGPRAQGQEVSSNTFPQTAFPPAWHTKDPQRCACWPGVSTATGRHSAHSSGALQTSHSPPQGALLTSTSPENSPLARSKTLRNITVWHLMNFTSFPLPTLTAFSSLWAVEFPPSLLHERGPQVKKFHALSPASQIILFSF